MCQLATDTPVLGSEYLCLSTYVSLYLLFMSLHLFIPLPTSLCFSLLLPLWILFCCYFDITKRYQDIHRDTPPLFAELSHEVPMYQLAINFPLCDCTVEPWNGPVEIAKGTHIHSFSFISFHPSSLSLSCLPHCFPSPFFVATRWFLPHFISFLIFVFFNMYFLTHCKHAYERTRSSEDQSRRSEFGTTGNERYAKPSLRPLSSPLFWSIYLSYIIVGDVMVRDVRGLHRGTPNKTDKARPMVVVGYPIYLLSPPSSLFHSLTLSSVTPVLTLTHYSTFVFEYIYILSKMVIPTWSSNRNTQKSTPFVI